MGIFNAFRDITTVVGLNAMAPGMGTAFGINRLSGQGYDFGGALGHSFNDQMRASIFGGSASSFAMADAMLGEGWGGVHDGSNYPRFQNPYGGGCGGSPYPPAFFGCGCWGM